jgi:hypothetical protein
MDRILAPVLFHLCGREDTVIQSLNQCLLVEFAADEHELRSAVAPLVVPVLFDAGTGGEVVLLLGLRKRGDPRPFRTGPDRLACFVEPHRDVFATGRPEKALRANDSVREVSEETSDPLGVERAVSVEDERGDTVFFGG